eukprot:TRINITY_DN83929_c0_g1_i1.p1 TRINITY_DN83929_c0_g1~~TRINITY_DN83929_c0_g1_i1.p1  ORF type:complete len:231 (+),score=21.86 TRINITY_DN83929_c0_g1_i1:134-826(+)
MLWQKCLAILLVVAAFHADAVVVRVANSGHRGRNAIQQFPSQELSSASLSSHDAPLLPAHILPARTEVRSQAAFTKSLSVELAEDEIEEPKLWFVLSCFQSLRENVAGIMGDLPMKNAVEANKIVLALINGSGLGVLGFDRMYMGSLGLGVLKMCTLGGFGIWALVDYVLILWNCALMRTSINVLGYQAYFGLGQELWAFWITLTCLIVKCLVSVRTQQFTFLKDGPSDA